MQKIDEGYIKFKCIHKNTDCLPVGVPEELKQVRNRLYQLGLIGHNNDLNVAYGNISIKIPEGILISATQTGIIPEISDTDFALVTQYDIDENTVWCIGKKTASSETMTHAALYEASKDIKAVIHIHNQELWKNFLYKLPTTNPAIPYGTPEMAYEMKRLYRESPEVKEMKIILMAGHEEGIISFGNSLIEAENALNKIYRA